MSLSHPTILVYSPTEAEEYATCLRNYGCSVLAASTVEEAKKLLPNSEVILGWQFPTSLLSQSCAANVRWFQSMGAGVNDLVADSSIPKNIRLTRIVGQFGAHISEYVFTYILFLLKDVPRMTQAQAERKWDFFIPENLVGKTIGIAGLGSIGAELVRKARAFDMNIHGLSYSGKQANIVDKHFMADEWNVFVKDLDYLVLTLPLTEKTQHIINRDILLAMKSDAYLINVGRGALIHEEELCSVLQAGHLRAAILDVFETEPLPKEHPFYDLDNIYITSHLSGPSTVEAVARFFIENLNRYMAKKPINGLVDRERGY